jgi:hypothetical protein
MLTHRLPPLALAALLAAGPALAQDQGFAIEITPPADEWTGFRIGVAVFGETVEPAAGYVRGCPGHVTAEAAGVLLQVAEGVQTLTLTLADDAIQGLVMATPDGLFRCVRRGADGLVAARLDRPEAGLYRVWPAGPEASRIATRMLVADRPISAIELRGLDVAALGAPRAGSHAFTGESPRQTLARGATLFAQDAMDPLNPAGYCAGFGRFDAPDAVLTLAEGQRNLAVYARSEVDLTLAVRTPEGQWYCNDDSFGLNPAVQVYGASAGDYLVYVGAYSQGAAGRYVLMAAMGEPNWEGLPDAGQPGRPNPLAEPSVGRVGFGPATAIDPRVIFDIAPSQTEARGLGEGCVGFITPAQPDLVVSAEPRLPQLMVYMVAENDGVLLVVGPDGTTYCNDDFDGLNPGVMIPNPMAGDYAVFAGTYGGQGGIATLGVTIANPIWAMDREH